MRPRLTWLLRFCAAAIVPVVCGCALIQDRDPIVTVLPPADAEPGRWVILDGANNTRDIGGYTTRDGRTVRRRIVYRSGALSDLTPAGCEAYLALGVRRVIDFRNRLAPSPLFGGDAVCVYLSSAVDVLPVRTIDPDPLLPTYVQTVRAYAGSYRRAFELLADPENLPLLYHCAAGKDRTGIMTALLLTLLGVDRETVVADYTLSDLVGAGVDPQAIIDLLDEVEDAGGIESYLEAVGVSPDTRAAIHDILLE